MKAILGKKIGMTQLFTEKGDVVPVTLIQAGPCHVLQLKTVDKDGYEAVQIGFQALRKSRQGKKSMKGKEFMYIREFEKVDEVKVGDTFDVSIFAEGDMVKVAGISKGKGFQGGVKRHGFSGMGASHGVKHEHRTLGSVGSAYPQRVVKGRKMPGHMGAGRITTKNLKIVKVDVENNLIAVKGAVPGPNGNFVEIKV